MMAGDRIREWSDEKAAHEQNAVAAFCDRHPDSPKLEKKNEPPAPDFTLKIGANRALVELARYRERGPHNDAYELDQEFRSYYSKKWIADDRVNEFYVSLTYRKTSNHFRIPSIRKSTDKADALIADLKRLVISMQGVEPRQHVTVRLFPKEQLRQNRECYVHSKCISTEAFPALAEFVERMLIFHQPGIRTGYPDTSIGTMHSAIDQGELKKLIKNKHSKLVQYRASCGDTIPVWLLVYDEGDHPTGRVPDVFFRSLLGDVGRMIDEVAGGSFDAVWWGHKLLTADAQLCRIR